MDIPGQEATIPRSQQRSSQRDARSVQSRGMKQTDISHIHDFLGCATPNEWLAEAAKPENLQTLLCDHANLEQKAAQSAMTTIRRYAHGNPGIADNSGTGQGDLLNKMSRLAREELRHFEQVLALMASRGITYLRLSPSRYAAQLHQHVRSQEPFRLTDVLIVGAFIEARSCERFASLAPCLDEELCGFYQSLLKSESRHYQDYIKLAELCADAPIENRIDEIRLAESELVQSPDPEFRFHSGAPMQNR